MGTSSYADHYHDKMEAMKRAPILFSWTNLEDFSQINLFIYIFSL